MVQDFPLSATAPNGSAAIATSEPASIPLSRDTVRSSLYSSPMGRHRRRILCFVSASVVGPSAWSNELIVTYVVDTARSCPLTGTNQGLPLQCEGRNTLMRRPCWQKALDKGGDWAMARNWCEDLDFCTHATRSGSGLGCVKRGGAKN